MIVRILGDGQFELDAKAFPALEALDAVVEKAVEAGDAPGYEKAVHALIDEVHRVGTALSHEEIAPSDLVIPDPTMTLDEVRALLAEATEA